MVVRRRGYTPQSGQQKLARLDKPEHLAGYASEHWDRVVPKLTEMGLLHPVDADALVALCQWWAEYRILQATPAGDSDSYKRSIALASCFKNWSNLAARFGLTPKDREKLTLHPPKEHDPAAEFLA